MMKFVIGFASWCLLIGAPELQAEETLAPLEAGRAPTSHSELWSGFDPRAEPLEIEVLKEWEEDGVVLKVLRYRIGIFNGQKAMMAAVYGYPKGGENLPGLVQIHGGGQYADYRAPLTNAKRGYATISISWAGRIHAPGHMVTPAEVKLFWKRAVENPAYRLTTDWGNLDAYHAPTRSGAGGFGGTAPSDWTLDSVESPRNDPWFLCTLGARRALTYLEKQPEVDGNRLGVYGHSMGGKLTVLTAGADSRVKAAVPSCGGVSDRSDSQSPNDDHVALRHISCPILFQSPANDFHGRINDLQKAVTEIQSSQWRVTCSPHHNHQDTPAYEVASQLWFDQYLRSDFEFPETPEISVDLDTQDGIPATTIVVDEALPILAVDVFYTRHGEPSSPENSMSNTKSRFWHHVGAENQSGSWAAKLPLQNTEQPVWIYANVTYALMEPASYAGYYYRVGVAEDFCLSSRMLVLDGAELTATQVKATLPTTTMIETFEGDWQKQWFTYRPEEWGRRTHKVYDRRWAAPMGAHLAFEVLSEQPNALVVGLDNYAAEVALTGSAEWQSTVLSLDDFKDADGTALMQWDGIQELRLLAADVLNRTRRLGGSWKGSNPQFRNLRWIQPTKP